MTLFLLRHGHAWPDAPSDALRDLSPRGQEEVTAVLQDNVQSLSEVERIFCSPFRRARQTADIAVECLNVDLDETDLLIPSASIAQLVEFLQLQYERYASVLLVAHNPLLENLLNYLVGEERGFLHLGTGSLACLQAQYPAGGACQLEWLRRADL